QPGIDAARPVCRHCESVRTDGCAADRREALAVRRQSARWLRGMARRGGSDVVSEVAAPVFILAAPFSGASLLAERLAAHPQLYVIPETQLFCADDVGALLEIFEISQGINAD